MPVTVIHDAEVKTVGELIAVLQKLLPDALILAWSEGREVPIEGVLSQEDGAINIVAG